MVDIDALVDMMLVVIHEVIDLVDAIDLDPIDVVPDVLVVQVVDAM